jgi:phosphoglycerate dehydrogenase-like enzyme
MPPLTLLVLGSPKDTSLSPVRDLKDIRVGLGPDAASIAASLGGTEALREAEALLVATRHREVVAELLAQAPNLKWVHSRSAGIDHLMSPALRDAPVVMTNGRGVFSAALAEFALAGVLHFWKDVPYMQRTQAEKRWAPFAPLALGGKTLGLVGYGDIGRAVARRARAFDMNVIAVRRSAASGEDDLGTRFLQGAGALLELMRTSDAVVVVAALTAETEGLVSAEAIAALPPHAVLVNVARGALIDEGALVEALRARRLRGAALDVFVEEPLPAGHAFWTLDNVLLSPHCADNVPGWLESAVSVFLDNLARFQRGEPLANRVDPARGY